MTTPPDHEHPLEDRLRSHLRSEVDLTGSGAGAASVSARATRRRTRQRTAMLVATLALVGGGVFVATSLDGNDSDPLDVAAGPDTPAATASSTEADNSSDGATGPSADDTADAPAPPVATPEFDAADSAMFETSAIASTQSVVVAVDGGFARLDTTYAESGEASPQSTTTLFRSADGVTWNQVGRTDLPTDTTLSAWGSQGITETADGFVAIANSWSGTTTDLFIARSTDLLAWVLTPLPAPDLDLADGLRLTAWADRTANGPNGVLVLGSLGVEVDYVGLLGPDMAESHCGEGSDGSTVEIFDCDTGDVMAEFGPGDPYFEATRAAEEFWSSNAGSLSTTWLLTADGAEIVNDNLGDVVLTGIASTTEHYIGIGFEATRFDNPESAGVPVDDAGVPLDDAGAVVVRSTDGIEWERIDATGGAFSAQDVFHSILAQGDTLVVVGSCEGNGVAWVSTDEGSTWTMTILVDNNEGTTSAWVDQAAAGPAGFVVSITEDASHFEEMADSSPDFSQAEPVSADLGGAVLTIDLANDSMTLVADDGTVLVEASSVWSEEPNVNWSEDGVEFLDADGEVVFTAAPELVDEAFEAAYGFGDSLPDEGMAIEYEPPTMSLFGSTDGITWTPLELPASIVDTAGWTSALAVGVDGALIAYQTQLEPPPDLWLFEEEGRVPTPEENQALELWFASSSVTEWFPVTLG